MAEQTQTPVAAESPMQRFLKQATDFDAIIKSLEFGEASVIQAAADQPLLFIKAARARVQTMRKSMRVAAQLKEVEADADRSIRASLIDQGMKPTDTATAARVTLDSDVVTARMALRQAEAEEELGKLLIEAMRHRRDSIRVISEANLIEGHSAHSEELRATGNRELSERARRAQAARRQAGTNVEESEPEN